MDKEKKLVSFNADVELIKSFKFACKNQDTTVSHALRAFMREYVKKHGQGDLFKK